MNIQLVPTVEYPGHIPTVTIYDTPESWPVISNAVKLGCSCGWSVSLLLSQYELEEWKHPQLRVKLWINDEWLGHLLDQEIKEDADVS